MASRSRLILLTTGVALSISVGMAAGSLVSAQSQAATKVIEVNRAVEDEPITVSRAGEDGELVCASGVGGQFCTLGTSSIPAIGVTEWADGSVRVTLLDPRQQDLELVLTSGSERTVIPIVDGSSVIVTRLEAVPDLIEAVTSTGEVVASYDGTRLAEMRDKAAKAASGE